MARTKNRKLSTTAVKQDASSSSASSVSKSPTSRKNSWEHPSLDALPSIKLPCTWTKASKFGDPVHRFLPFKLPLDSKKLGKMNKNDQFDWKLLSKNLRGRSIDLGLVIDLSCEPLNEYSDLENCTLDILKIDVSLCPLASRVYEKFSHAVNTFLEDDNNSLKYIGVCCLSGVDMCGLLICKYLICNDRWMPNYAISMFSSARKHQLSNPSYLDHLRSLKPGIHVVSIGTSQESSTKMNNLKDDDKSSSRPREKTDDGSTSRSSTSRSPVARKGKETKVLPLPEDLDTISSETDASDPFSDNEKGKLNSKTPRKKREVSKQSDSSKASSYRRIQVPAKEFKGPRQPIVKKPIVPKDPSTSRSRSRSSKSRSVSKDSTRSISPKQSKLPKSKVSDISQESNLSFSPKVKRVIKKEAARLNSVSPNIKRFISKKQNRSRNSSQSSKSSTQSKSSVRSRKATSATKSQRGSSLSTAATSESRSPIRAKNKVITRRCPRQIKERERDSSESISRNRKPPSTMFVSDRFKVIDENMKMQERKLQTVLKQEARVKSKSPIDEETAKVMRYTDPKHLKRLKSPEKSTRRSSKSRDEKNIKTTQKRDRTPPKRESSSSVDRRASSSLNSSRKRDGLTSHKSRSPVRKRRKSNSHSEAEVLSKEADRIKRELKSISYEESDAERRRRKDIRRSSKTRTPSKSHAQKSSKDSPKSRRRSPRDNRANDRRRSNSRTKNVSRNKSETPHSSRFRRRRNSSPDRSSRISSNTRHRSPPRRSISKTRPVTRKRSLSSDRRTRRKLRSHSRSRSRDRRTDTRNAKPKAPVKNDREEEQRSTKNFMRELVGQIQNNTLDVDHRPSAAAQKQGNTLSLDLNEYKSRILGVMADDNQETTEHETEEAGSHPTTINVTGHAAMPYACQTTVAPLNPIVVHSFPKYSTFESPVNPLMATSSVKPEQEIVSNGNTETTEEGETKEKTEDGDNKDGEGEKHDDSSVDQSRSESSPKNPNYKPRFTPETQLISKALRHFSPKLRGVRPVLDGSFTPLVRPPPLARARPPMQPPLQPLHMQQQMPNQMQMPPRGPNFMGRPHMMGPPVGDYRMAFRGPQNYVRGVPVNMPIRPLSQQPFAPRHSMQPHGMLYRPDMNGYHEGVRPPNGMMPPRPRLPPPDSNLNMTML